MRCKYISRIQDTSILATKSHFYQLIFLLLVISSSLCATPGAPSLGTLRSRLNGGEPPHGAALRNALAPLRLCGLKITILLAPKRVTSHKN
jgi:hypothetical protein